jgi:hypothetical protein
MLSLFDEEAKGYLKRADLERMFRVISNDLNLNPMTKEDFNILAYNIVKEDIQTYTP